MRYRREFVTSAPLSCHAGSRGPMRMRTNVENFRVNRRLYCREWNWLWNWLCVNQHPWQRTRGDGVWRLTSIAHCQVSTGTKYIRTCTCLQLIYGLVHWELIDLGKVKAISDISLGSSMHGWRACMIASLDLNRSVGNESSITPDNLMYQLRIVTL